MPSFVTHFVIQGQRWVARHYIVFYYCLGIIISKNACYANYDL